MPKVEIKDKQIWVGRESIPFVSGEVHYWRLNPNYWKEVLARVREMGITVVSTYVPWHYHEHKRGHFDFTGTTHDTRDLKRFLDLTRKEGFWLVIRPGPYIYSEWPNEGVPSYAYKYHRLHPTFLKYASEYIKRVSAVFKPYLATRKGGHIIMVQADNEIDPWPDVFGQQYGLDGKPGMFQDYLKQLYGKNIKKLNENWGTEYRRFEEAGAFIATMFADEKGLLLKGDKELKRNIDYFKFKYHYSKETAKWSVKAYRDRGIDVPIYLNLYPFFYAHDWSDMQEASDLVGVDLYPTSELAEDKFEQRKFIDKIRYLGRVSRIPFIAEFAAGVWHNRHYETGVLTPNHYRLISISALLGGVMGWNWYMLVNRDNWYMSPINEWGRVRPELYKVFKELVSIYRQMNPPVLKKLTEIGVTFNPLQHAARTLHHNSPILVGLYDSDIDYELYDPRADNCPKKFLFYSGNQWLEESSQIKLRRYVEGGGTLIAFRDYPRKDDNFRNCQKVGFHDPKSILFEFKKEFSVQMAPGLPKVKLVSSVYTFTNVRGKKITADFGSFGRHTIGYIKKLGKGRIVHLGVDPTRELIMEILKYLKVPLVAYSTTRDIKTALFQEGSRYFLVAVNNGTEDKSASIYLPALDANKAKMSVRDLDSTTTEAYSRERRSPFTADFPRKNGRVFEISRIKK
ncbi:MAG: beta-galactosidase [Candidatus Omnitrophota bacterium]|nr:beta-galactosidase [Candidatus Omnitrophota bacterium]